MNSFRKFYIFSVIGILAASFYPLYMRELFPIWCGTDRF